jgi:hypothetical protein
MTEDGKRQGLLLKGEQAKVTLSITKSIRARSRVVGREDFSSCCCNLAGFRPCARAAVLSFKKTVGCQADTWRECQKSSGTDHLAALSCVGAGLLSSRYYSQVKEV